MTSQPGALLHPSNAAEDVASETWLEVVRGLGQFTGDEAGFRSWGFAIACHRALDDRRRRARRFTVPLPVELAVGWQGADHPGRIRWWRDCRPERRSR
jgi:RNA polymerase sigma-70 factor, ECF subfamily